MSQTCGCLQVFVGSTCYLFDMLQITEPFLQQLKSILEDLNVTKVMHDCRQDSAALFYQFGIKLHNVLDTQVLMLVCVVHALLSGCSIVSAILQLYFLAFKAIPDSKCKIRYISEQQTLCCATCILLCASDGQNVMPDTL